MKVPDNFQCEECGAILREMHEAWQSDWKGVKSLDQDPMVLRNEWLNADELQTYELYRTHYPRTIAVRRRRIEHEILTGHNAITHGLRSAWFGPRL